MSTHVRPGTKDHWSLRLNIKRPGDTNRLVLLGLALLQALLLYLTASSAATNGSLYGCSTPCGANAQPTTPWIAILISLAIFILPAVIGALTRTWQEAVGLAALPWGLAVIFQAKALLAPTASVIPATHALPAASQFSAPFWLDAARLTPLLWSLVLFAALGWIGWFARQAISDA